MMRIDAALRIVTIFFVWTPACFVEKHVEDIPLLFGIDSVELLVEIAEL